MILNSLLKYFEGYPTLNDPMDCSLPGSSVHGIFQARVLEWGAIAFSIVMSNISLISLHRPPCLLPYAWKRLLCIEETLKKAEEIHTSPRGKSYSLFNSKIPTKYMTRNKR